MNLAEVDALPTMIPLPTNMLPLPLRTFRPEHVCTRLEVRAAQVRLHLLPLVLIVVLSPTPSSVNRPSNHSPRTPYTQK